jgi:hypothetical protein
LNNIDDEEPFFRQSDTLDALAELAKARHLVIYCGAGVSVDRTGVGWRDVVREVFDGAKTHRTDKESEISALEFLIEKLDDPRQAASIVVEALMSPGQTENSFLTPKLHHVLYEKNHWQRGYMLRNLVQLAIAAATANRTVQLITTNYDDFIEREFLKQFEALEAGGLDKSEFPKVERRVTIEGSKRKPAIIQAAGKDAGTGSVELVYLHGRVDEKGKPTEGLIVLTEQSYALSRAASQATLEGAFGGPDKAVLVVGASLTDDPLIAALSNTKAKRGARFALLALPTKIEKSLNDPHKLPSNVAAAVPRTLRLRGAHIGIDVLNPMSHFQSSQFLEELRVSISAFDKTGDPDHYRQIANGISYAARLHAWGELWNARADTMNVNYASEELRKTLVKYVRLVLKPKASAGERFRAELWARRNPRTNNRNLTLWANSTGPFRDDSIFRAERISHASRNASVQTFTEGRPGLRGIDELEFPADASRWQTFFSMPIFVSVPITIGTAEDAAYIPAGVLTITSDKSMTVKDATGHVSVINRNLDAKSFEDLKYQLIAAGRRILSVTDGPS